MSASDVPWLMGFTVAAVFVAGVIAGYIIGHRSPPVRESDVPVHRGRTIPVEPYVDRPYISHGRVLPTASGLSAYPTANTLTPLAGHVVGPITGPVVSRLAAAIGQRLTPAPSLAGHRGDCRRVVGAQFTGRLDHVCSCDYEALKAQAND